MRSGARGDYAAPAMPRFELRDGRSNKVWVIEREGVAITTSWGTVGAKLHTTTKRYEGLDATREAGRELIRERTRKGYVRVSPAAERVGFARNEGLETAVLEGLGADEPLSIYADWLAQAGDRRGELGALQLAAARGDEAAATGARALLSLIEPALLGEGASLLGDSLHVEYRGGFVDEVAWWPEDVRGADSALRAVLEGGSCRFVRRLEIWERSGDGAPFLAMLDALEPAPPLESLRLRTSHHVDGDAVDRVARRYPGLSRLYLDLPHASLGALRAPRLEALDVGWLESSDALSALFAGDGLPRLRSLTLRGYAPGLPRALADARLTKQLAELDLSGLALGDEDAVELIERFDLFRHLNRLELDLAEGDLAQRLAALRRGER